MWGTLVVWVSGDRECGYNTSSRVSAQVDGVSAWVDGVSAWVDIP